MSIAAPTTEAEIFSRMIALESGDMSEEFARQVLSLEFAPEDQEEMHRLVVKNQAGELTPDERLQMESYRNISLFVDILKAKARLTLRHRTTTD